MAHLNKKIVAAGNLIHQLVEKLTGVGYEAKITGPYQIKVKGCSLMEFWQLIEVLAEVHQLEINGYIITRDYDWLSFHLTEVGDNEVG
jgi:hypothetical protein